MYILPLNEKLGSQTTKKKITTKIKIMQTTEWYRTPRWHSRALCADGSARRPGLGSAICQPWSLQESLPCAGPSTCGKRAPWRRSSGAAVRNERVPVRDTLRTEPGTEQAPCQCGWDHRQHHYCIIPLRYGQVSRNDGIHF